jgi:bifunctional aspartokinase / homoserine dehydrogenase 1
MKHTVIKLGGSVLRGPSDSRAILDILEGYRAPLVVVVSALKGVTDRLAAALSSPPRLVELIPQLREEYSLFAASFGAPPAAEAAALLQIDRLLGLCACPAASGDGRARLLALGERLAAVCISLALTSLGRPAPVIEPGRLGLVARPLAEDREDAEADIPASRPRICASLAGRDLAVVPGFYALAEDGSYCLFGRGGSDYSAAVIAACLGAESCDFIKGVAGFFTADPALVPAAKPVRSLSYAEAEALAKGGAKVLHQGCVEPLREAGVPFRIVGGPSLGGQTRVGSGGSMGAAGPKAVALMLGPSGSAAITVAGGAAASKSAAIALRALEARGLQARAFFPGADSSSFRFLVEAARGNEALTVVHDALFPAALARAGGVAYY